MHCIRRVRRIFIATPREDFDLWRIDDEIRPRISAVRKKPGRDPAPARRAPCGAAPVQ
jgi:hypothetical protein